jgi:hypothetical protein
MRSVIYKTFLVSALFLLLVSPLTVSADTLFISPAHGEYVVGDTFSIRVLTSSPLQAINAVSGVISFPTDKLRVTSISKTSSILSLWVQEPSFSNSQGTVNFEGVVPNPGFNRANGVVLTVSFRVEKEGTASLRFSSGSLLANDGYGTDILRTLGTATFTLKARAPTQVVPTVEAPEEEVLPAPIDLIKTPKLPEPVVEEGTPIYLPSFASVIEWLLKFLSIVIPLVALIFMLIYLMGRGVDNIRQLKKTVRKDLHSIDRLVEKSFDLLKEDISDSINTLERARMKRKLTAEEDAIIHRLRQNLVDAERIIHKEVLNAEKDIGN